jgi:nucleotide-binding universal stress UspA family protein
MAIAYKRVLNPVDFDPNSIATMSVAAQFARPDGGTVYLLHVIPMIGQPAGGPAYMELYQEEVVKSNKKLEQLAKTHLVGVKHEIATEIGNAAELILEAEKKHKADLIVMGTHGRTGLARMFLGSVAEAVLHGAECPVIAFRHTA